MQHPEQSPDLHTVTTLCVTCGGDGYVSAPKAATVRGSALTLNPGQPCPSCNPDGKAERPGRVHGFQPPV